MSVQALREERLDPELPRRDLAREADQHAGLEGGTPRQQAHRLDAGDIEGVPPEVLQLQHARGEEALLAGRVQHDGIVAEDDTYELADRALERASVPALDGDALRDLAVDTPGQEAVPVHFEK